jgi:cytochrome P450
MSTSQGVDVHDPVSYRWLTADAKRATDMTTERDWAHDYDLFDPEYAADPYPIWAELRTACPVAHTDRYGGSWMPTTYEDVMSVARDPATFSSRNVSVVPPPDDTEGELLPAGLPPIQADPPVHTWTRRLLLPWFSNDRVAAYEGFTRELCRTLLDRFAASGRADAAADYAKPVPVRVIGKMLGIPEEMSDTFIEWVRSVLEFANDAPRRTQAQIESTTYFLEEMEARRHGDGTDLISELLRAEVDGNPVPDEFVVGTVALILIAGLDTTWSALGSMLWHLARNPDDTRRLVHEPRARSAAHATCRWCSREGPYRPGGVREPRPLFRHCASPVRVGRARDLIGDRRRIGVACRRGARPARRRQLP